MMVSRLYSRCILFFYCLMALVQVNAQVEKDPSKIYFINLEALITEKVKDRVEKWAIKGEFETTREYEQRLNRVDEKIEQFTEEAKNFYMQDFINKVNFNDYRLSLYDADRETFKVTLGLIGDFILPVERSIAKEFKEKALSGGLDFQNIDFEIKDNSWSLSYIDVVCNGQTHTYNVKNQMDYNAGEYFDPDAKIFGNIVDAYRRRNRTGGPVYVSLEDENYNIDRNLPASRNGVNRNAIAVIIGNRNYEFTKNVEFANRDALKMKQYLVEVLGYRPGNIIEVSDATQGDFNSIFGTGQDFKGQLYNQAQRYGDSDIFIFYSGHGAPGLQTKSGYFVPVECRPNQVELAGYPLEQFYLNLKKVPANSITVVLDACFSGAEILENISPIGIRIRSISNNDEKTVVLSSSSDTEVSSWYNAKKHGLFTYFFLKAIHDKENSDANRDGSITYTELYKYLSDNVNYGARLLHSVEQNPTIMGGNKEGVFFQYK